MKKSRFASSILVVLLFISSMVSVVQASRGASAAIYYPVPLAGALGYRSYDHEYIYAFMNEPDIQIKLGTTNEFDFTQYYPPKDVFIADTGFLDTKNTDFNLNNFTPLGINDASLSAYADEIAYAKTFFNMQGISEEQIGVIIIPEEEAAKLTDQTLSFTYVRHFGGGDSFGFDYYIYTGNMASVKAHNAQNANRITYQLVEPTLQLEVDKTLRLTNGTQGDTMPVDIGDIIHFTVTIKNTSDIWLEDVVLEDNLFGPNVSNIKIDGINAFLNSNNKLELGNMKGARLLKSPSSTGTGKEIVVTYDYTVSQSDVTLENSTYKILNKAVATGTTPKNSYDKYVDGTGEYPYVGPALSIVKPVSADDSVVLQLNDEPKTPNLSIKKTSSRDTAALNDIITYTLDITNSGEIALNQIDVSDALAPDGGGWNGGHYLIPDLEVGETAVIAYKYTVTEANVKAGSISNTAIARSGAIEVTAASKVTTITGSPQTGDNDMIWLSLGLIVFAALMLFILTSIKRQRKI